MGLHAKTSWVQFSQNYTLRDLCPSLTRFHNPGKKLKTEFNVVATNTEKKSKKMIYL